MKKIFILSFLVFYLISCSSNENIEKNVGNNNQKLYSNDDKKLEIKKEKNFMEESFSQIKVDEFKQKLSTGEYVLLDVRTPEELPIYGKLSENQILIDINSGNFAQEVKKLDKTKKYLIYCWHGNRSQVARDYMRQIGFTYVKDLEGGIDVWEDLGEKVIR